ncbi:M13 family metallopeptidase [Mycoplasmopsis felis]|uniref:M13 family metallopeptidase n=1 Tax=Mycoplasmopsis felis TaxID=33923 RepID=UPI002AFE22E5|nr:M13 family metallopeptidase [Mycoplasmopsis felis]WQQ09342.1 M13 family metallopeptidase [Mycoplasmopsis felis]
MKPLLKDDFFEYVNYEWLKEAKIPDDRSSIGSFVELDMKLEKLLKSLIFDWSTNKKEIPSKYPLLKEMIKFHSMILDQNKREELSWKPIKNYLNKLLEINSFSDLYNQDRDFWLSYNSLPVEIQVYEDFVENTKKIVWLDSLSCILPSKETYQQETEKTKLLTSWKNMVVDLLIDYGFSKQKSESMVENAIKFDDLLKDYLLSSVEQANYVALYNLKQRDELNGYINKFNLINLLDLIIGQEVTEASIPNLRLYKNFDKIFSEENFALYKDLLFINNLLSNTSYLSEKIRIKATEYKKTVYSINKERSLSDYAFDLTSKYFGMPLGMFYAHEYFGQKAKEDVEYMVKSMIEVYKERLQKNDWLSKETIQKAIIKLNKFDYMVGFPEEIRPYYKKFMVKTYQDGSNIFENIRKFRKHITNYNLSLYHKSESKKLWGMSPATVNAYYNPTKNHIVFPAGILSSPFYNINASKSSNYGSIGAVIAHEISHGFDNNGAQFDENGALNNWWTENDLKEFQKRTQSVIELYDKRETKYGPVNGKLTVSENIADIGGLSCALEAAKREPDFSLEEFFISWAKAWRSAYKEGTAKRLLDSDVHAPAKIRANIVAANMDEFQDFFKITENDKMYIKPSKRVKIW